MNNNNSSVIIMWKSFIKLHPEYEIKNYTAWHFCNDNSSANKLADLVKAGIKKSTASLLYWYEKNSESLPEAGNISVVTDWNGTAKCVIRNTAVRVLPFNEVTEEIAFIEGEGDKSLNHWRRVHTKFNLSFIR